MWRWRQGEAAVGPLENPQERSRIAVIAQPQAGPRVHQQVEIAGGHQIGRNQDSGRGLIGVEDIGAGDRDIGAKKPAAVHFAQHPGRHQGHAAKAGGLGQGGVFLEVSGECGEPFRGGDLGGMEVTVDPLGFRGSMVQTV